MGRAARRKRNRNVTAFDFEPDARKISTRVAERTMQTLLVAFAAILLVPSDLGACSIVGDISPARMIEEAHLILRVTAVEYAKAPSDPNLLTTGTPDSVVRFRVEERIKGRTSLLEVEIPGYLRDRDDFNDRPVPYDFVRPTGRSGSCHANTYRPGSEYLLFLRLIRGAYTIEWYPLGPSNEQLRGPDDPWVKWVRERVAELQ